MNKDEVWNTGRPKQNVWVRVKCDDFRGEYEILAMMKPYKRPKPGECKKGFMKGARWVNEAGESLTRKETPSGWLPI